MATRIGVKTAVRAAVLAYGASLSASSLALGLGEIDMQSFLNEPLRAEVELLDTRRLTTDDIRIRLAGVDDFDRLGVDRSYFLTSIQFEVVVDETTGRGVIRLSTEEAVLEPYLDIIIEARWPSGRLLREYTVLVDPPAFRQELVTVSASDRVQETTDLSKPGLAEDQPEAPPPAELSTSGDAVAMRESSLGPGEMPRRSFSAETASMPEAGSRYMVKRDETLWQIASQGKPQGISVQQAMLDIQRVNPEAFINGNINQIKAGYIIYLPAAGEVSSDALAEAIDEVRAQNRQWQASRTAPGVTTAATLRVSAEPSEPLLEVVEDASATSEQMGSRVDDAAGSVDAPALPEPDTMDAEEVPAGADVASAELAAQLDAMAERLDTLEQIVSLKDQQIATLEQALREAREAAAAAPAPTPAPAAAPAPAVDSQPAPRSTGGSSVPWMPIGGGLLVLALGILFFLRRRASAAAATAEAPSVVEAPEDDVFAGVSLKKEALPVDDDEPAASTVEAAVAEAPEPAEDDAGDELDRGGSRGYGERKHDDYIDDSAGGDALAEADIYIAYGRYLQAIELLDTAIANDPGNSAYRVKLIELYVDMGEEDSAQAQLEALREHGDADSIGKAEALVGSGSSADDTGFDLSLDPVEEPQPVEEPAPAEEPVAIADVEEPEPAIAAVPDVDLVAEEEPAAPSAPAEPDVDAPIEYETGDSMELELEDASASELTPALDDSEELEEIEFDHLEIEEDIGAADHDVLAADDADDELDLSEALVSEADAGAEEEAGEELLIAEDADQMATKLDLARAYIDMGDSDGAKAILQEVADGGTGEQQQEANDLLSRID